MFMSRFIQMDYHAGQIFIPHRHTYLPSITTDPFHWGAEGAFSPDFRGEKVFGKNKEKGKK